MAESQAQANNAKILFRRKAEHEMPMRSKAQLGAMFAAAAGHSTLGIPKRVGKKFVKESHGQKIKGLPKKVHAKALHLHKRGMISEKALKRMTESA